MKFKVVLLQLVALCWFNLLSAQQQVDLEVINPDHENFAAISRAISRSVAPAFPVQDTMMIFQDTLFIEGYAHYDYSYRLSYGDVNFLPFNEAGFRLFLKSGAPIKLVVDTDLDGFLQDEKILNLQNLQVEFPITINEHTLYYKCKIWDVNSVRSYQFGGVATQPLSYFSGIVEVNGKEANILIEDEVLGVFIHMENMWIGSDSLKRVLLHEPFFYGDTYYSFYEFDVGNLTVKLKQQSKNFKPEGYREGYYVKKEVLQEKLGTNIEGRPTLLYFWGIWCKPCVENFQKPLNLYRKIITNTNANMLFCSYNFEENHAQQCLDFISGRVELSHQVFLNEKTEQLAELSEFVKYESLTSLLKINAYPTYILIDQEGKIVFRGNEINDDLLKLLE